MATPGSHQPPLVISYALVIGGISIVLLAAFAGLSGALSGVVTDITTALGGGAGP